MTSSTAILATTIPAEHIRIAVNATTEPFWAAAKEGRLVAPQCAHCRKFRLPPTPFCPNCRSKALNWPELTGEATVYSFAVVHGVPGLPDLVLVPAVLDLPDAPGARLVSNVVDVDPADVFIGMRLRVDFVPIADGWMLPIFRVAADGRGGSSWMSDDSALHEKPLEFLTGIANTGGSCDGQMILPEGGHFRCTCSCGDWDLEVDDAQDGLRQARIHTGSMVG